MNFLFPLPTRATVSDATQSRLLNLAGLFLFLLALVLTLAPAVRAHSWQVSYSWSHWIGFIVWLVFFALVHRTSIQLLPERDPFLIPISALLSGWGLLTIWRISLAFGLRQTIWLSIALGLLWFGLRFNKIPHFLRQYKYIWLTGGLALMGLTFILGTYPEGGSLGPHLWLRWGWIYLQPSEPLKLLLIVYLAAYLADHVHIRFGMAQMLVPTLGLTVSALLLLIAQRDLGTASLFLFFYAALIFFASDRLRVMVYSVLGITLASVLGYFAFDVVKLRMDAWVNPWLDPGGRSYQIIQSLISIASGGILGRGFGIGSPSLVPVSHSDFIFAAISEELGLIGSLSLVLVLGLLVQRGFRIALNAVEPYQRYLAAGLTAFLAAQSILIIGGNIRLLPLTGVTLPFVSYGGSSLLVSFLALLLLLHISSHPDQEPAWLPSPRPYYYLGTILLIGLFSTSMVSLYWGVVRSPELLARGDNIRRYLSDQYVKRGTIFDRHGTAINSSVGTPGSYQRISSYPDLASVVGYTHPIFAQAGLEARLDPTLRGLQGYPDTFVWQHDLLYGQPPPGLDVRLSLDLQLQQLADQLLTGQKGALVLLNSRTGEILVMSSHPTFDPNALDQNWESILSSPDAPLLNRATQGQYPPGTASGPFLLASVSQAQLAPLPQFLGYSIENERFLCSYSIGQEVNWGNAVRAGCPAALVHLAEQIGPEPLTRLFKNLGFYATPQIPLEVAPAVDPGSITDLPKAAVGQENLTVSPIQMALAAASLSAEGYRPTPHLVIAVNQPDLGWTNQPNPGEPILALPSEEARMAALTLADANGVFWTTTGTGRSGAEDTITWFLGGTLPNWEGEPLSMALVLEKDDPELANQIGAEVLLAAARP